MKFTSRRFACCARWLTIGVIAAALSCHAGSEIEGVEWEYAYPGSAIPISGSESWTIFKGSTTPHPHHRGETLVISTNDTLVQQLYYTSTEWKPSSETGVASIEVRVKLEAVAKESMNEAAVVLAVATPSGGTALYLGPGGLYLFPGSGEPVVADFNPFEAHTYRLLFNTAENLFSLEIDGEQKLSDHSLSTAFVGNILRIGDMSSSVGGIIHYEYVAWNNAVQPTRP